MLIFYLNSILFFRFLYKYIQIDKHSTRLNAIKAGFHVEIITLIIASINCGRLNKIRC